jgi:hypothetical protein
MKESTFVFCMIVIVVIAMMASLFIGVRRSGYCQGQVDALNGKWKVKQVIGVSTNYTTIN